MISDVDYLVLLLMHKIHLASEHRIGNRIIEARIIRHECSVKFYHFVPANMQDIPFIALVSVGVHTHVPPPPVKMPPNIVAELQKILRNKDVINISTQKLLTSNVFVLL